MMQEITMLQQTQLDTNADIKKLGSFIIQCIDGKYYDNTAWVYKSQNLQDARNKYLAKLTQGIEPTEKEAVDNNAAIVILSRKDQLRERIKEIEDIVLTIDIPEKLDEIRREAQSLRIEIENSLDRNNFLPFDVDAQDYLGQLKSFIISFN